MYYVSMKDTFLSNWGNAKGKTNLYVIKCETKEQVNQAKKAAHKREEMRDIQILTYCPDSSSTVLVSLKNYLNLGDIWTQGVQTDVNLYHVQRGLYKMDELEKMQLAEIVTSKMRSLRRKYMVTSFFDGIENRPKWGILERFHKCLHTGRWVYIAGQDEVTEIRGLRNEICKGGW